MVLDALCKVSDPTSVIISVKKRQCMEALRQRVWELKLEKQVHFSDIVPMLFPLLKKADIFCLSIFTEGMPVAVMEAMVLACPVVAYDIRGCRN